MKTAQKLSLFAATLTILAAPIFAGLSSVSASEGIQSVSGHGTQQTANFCRIYPWMCR